MTQILETIILCLFLSGCGGPVALMVLEGLASSATIADKIVGIDVSLRQQTPGKVPITAILTQPVVVPNQR